MGDLDRAKRNDSCPCGSGKKYKKCCLARDRTEQAERVAWEHAAQHLRALLIDFAKDKAFVKDLAEALGLFWQDRYTLALIQRMSVDESLRFFDWFVHDYRLQHQDNPQYSGKRLIEVCRIELGSSLSNVEAAVLDSWIESLPGSAFLLKEIDTAVEAVVVHDLCLEDRVLTVHDRSTTNYGEVGQILLARALPGRDSVYFSGATVVLPASEVDNLREYIKSEYEIYLAENGAAPKESFLRERAYLLTHYALEWADQQGRPAVSADDPNARIPGEKILQKAVKWKQDHVQIR